MDPIRLAEFIQFAAALAAAWRLMHLKLALRFPALFSWICVLAASNLFAALLTHSTGTYFWFYVVYVPVDCIFSFLAVQELFALTFANYPGIRSAGRWGMYVGILLATAGSFMVAGLFRPDNSQGSRHLLYLEVSKRSIVFSLAIVIATILFFLSRYPLHLGANTYVSGAFFSALFLSDAARLLMDSLQKFLHSEAVDLAEALFVIVCLVTWASLLRPYSPPKKVAPVVSDPGDVHLLGQLNSLNRLLEGAIRR